MVACVRHCHLLQLGAARGTLASGRLADAAGRTGVGNSGLCRLKRHLAGWTGTFTGGSHLAVLADVDGLLRALRGMVVLSGLGSLGYGRRCDADRAKDRDKREECFDCSHECFPSSAWLAKEIVM